MSTHPVCAHYSLYYRNIIPQLYFKESKLIRGKPSDMRQSCIFIYDEVIMKNKCFLQQVGKAFANSLASACIIGTQKFVGFHKLMT